jgi:hypothetical protein
MPDTKTIVQADDRSQNELQLELFLGNQEQEPDPVDWESLKFETLKYDGEPSSHGHQEDWADEA